MDLPGRKLLLSIPLVCAAQVPARAQDAGSWWIYFQSRESGQGRVPELVLRAKGGRSWELKAAADATVISYLEDRAFPRMVRLAVGTGDRNRALIRFELPKGLVAEDLEKADMVLDLELSRMAPRKEFELAFHRVLGPWDERTVTWAEQPEISKEAFRSTTLEPRRQILRIDVRSPVRRWLARRASNHGLLIRQAGPLAPKAPAKKQLIARLREQVGFVTSSREALARARRYGRVVLALVVSPQGRGAAGAIEQLLLAQAFCSPDLLALVKRRFVPLRLTYPPRDYTQQRVSRGGDPLAPLGTSCLRIKAPALLVSSAEGELLDSLQSIGTPGEEVVHRFLLRALAATAPVTLLPEAGSAKLLADGFLDAALEATRKEKSPGAEIQRARIDLLRGHPRQSLDCFRDLDAAWVEDQGVLLQKARAHMRLGQFAESQRLFEALAARSKHRAEAAYRLASLDWAGGTRQRALERFEALAKDEGAGPWSLRAAARLAWPERMAWAEPLRELRPLDASKSTEKPVPAGQVEAVVRRALVYLIEQQGPEGTWPVEARQYRMAVSAFAAKALLVWEPHMETELKARMRKALDRFEHRALTYLAKEDPRQASTFGATYLTDYFLEAHERAKTRKSLGRVSQAARFLIGGQCPNGAWSYSHAFGTSWRGGFGGWPRTRRGRTHSMNTGPALDFLLAAGHAGAEVPDEAVRRGLDVLARMRSAPGVYTYTFPDPISFQRADQSIARGPTCELALYLGDKASEADLLTTLRRFMKLRHALRTPVKLDPSWSSPHNFSSYFFFYAYYHGALGWKALLPIQARRAEAHRALSLLRDDLLQVVELDGTWIDFPEVGKAYATSAALLVLNLSR